VHPARATQHTRLGREGAARSPGTRRHARAQLPSDRHLLLLTILLLIFLIIFIATHFSLHGGSGSMAVLVVIVELWFFTHQWSHRRNEVAADIASAHQARRHPAQTRVGA
jgi:protein-S-isoprenylcysteine O-methyltransferase Ste14